MKSRASITFIGAVKSFWNFAQSTAVSLPCSVQTFTTIGQVNDKISEKEISRDLSLRCFSDGCPILQLSATVVGSNDILGEKCQLLFFAGSADNRFNIWQGALYDFSRSHEMRNIRYKNPFIAYIIVVEIFSVITIVTSFVMFMVIVIVIITYICVDNEYRVKHQPYIYAEYFQYYAQYFQYYFLHCFLCKHITQLMYIFIFHFTADDHFNAIAWFLVVRKARIRRHVYITITLTSQWPRWRLKSPASQLFTQSFIRAQIKENIIAPRHWPLCGEFTGTGEFPAQRASNAKNVSFWWRHHAWLICPWLSLTLLRWNVFN